MPVRSTGLGKTKIALAVEAGKKGNYRRAVKLLNELISETDAPPEAWLLLGRSLHALKDYSRALAAFNDYLRQKPNSGEGYLFAGRTYLAVAMPHRAVPFLRKALESYPKNSAAKALLGVAYLKSKHSRAAVQTLQEAVENAPENKRIYRAYLNSLYVRGIKLCRLEDYDLGHQMLRFVLENGRENGMKETPLLRLELGRAARETGKLEEALEHFTKALKISKDGSDTDGDRRIRWSRASILMALGKNTEARKEIEKIRANDEGVPELPWNSELVDLFMIRSFMESGEWRRAAVLCRDWLKLRNDPESRKHWPMIRVLYAETLRNLRDFDTAHNHLQRALETEPAELEFWYADILVCWEANDYKSLQKALNAASSLGGDEEIIKRFSILCHVRTSKNITGSIAMLQNAIRTMGPELELMYTLGELYLKAGLLQEAASWFKKIITLKEDHERAWLGQIAALETLHTTGELKNNGEQLSELSLLYEDYLKRWPDNSNLRRDRATFLIKTFEFAKASAELENLLIWEPSNTSLRRVLAYSYRKTGRYREAAVFLKALLREKPRDVGLLIEYAGCLERAGSAHYAALILEKAREILKHPDISIALGILSFKQKETEKAFNFLREAAALAPNDPRPYEWMAAFSRGKGNSDACSHYEKEAQIRKNRAKNKKRAENS